jgi:hypothetical protein
MKLFMKQFIPNVVIPLSLLDTIIILSTFVIIKKLCNHLDLTRRSKFSVGSHKEQHTHILIDLYILMFYLYIG